MEVIKKTILRAMTTGVTACTGTTGTCYVIIPDLNAVYHFKIGLTSIQEDIGFFDAFQPKFMYGYYGDGEPIGLGNLLL